MDKTDILISDLQDIKEILDNNGYAMWGRKISDAIELLKGQSQCENCAIAIEDRQMVVRCKDCVFGEECKDNNGDRIILCHYPVNGMFEYTHKPKWFCAYGKCSVT